MTAKVPKQEVRSNIKKTYIFSFDFFSIYTSTTIKIDWALVYNKNLIQDHFNWAFNTYVFNI